jgi:hypothetical protein
MKGIEGDCRPSGRSRKRDLTFGGRQAIIGMQTEEKAMARMVEVRIVYDMDDPGKPIKAELNDWLEGNVNVQDIVEVDGPQAITIREIEQETVETTERLDYKSAGATRRRNEED